MANVQNLEFWQSLSETLVPEGRAFIDGHYVEAADRESFACVSPIDQRILCQVASCQQADVDLAVSAARAAFESGVWSGLAPAARKTILLRFADLIDANADELALLETLDMGKPISDSRTVDINGTVRALRWTAEAVDKIYDEIAPTGPGELGMVTREAVGVVAAIVPWNFPISWQLGNSPRPWPWATALF
jgi:acyl-CoA reductase-like NAD-dependent aldehyde dehydrogenase